MLFTLTERCRLLQIHLSKCKSSFQADPACVNANMSAWWLLMDNDLTDNLHFKVLLFRRGYEPNVYLLLKVVFPPFLESICVLAAGHNGAIWPHLWTAVNHGRRRKITCWPWGLLHNKVSVSHRPRGRIHDPGAEYTLDRFFITADNGTKSHQPEAPVLIHGWALVRPL